jgi:hypothetical protein
LNASLFKKGLSENDLLRHCRLGQAQAFFEKGLIENPWKRRDKPAQRKPFQKRFERKPEKSFSLRALPPNPIRRDKPAQRFRRNGFGSTIVLSKSAAASCRWKVNTYRIKA